MLQYLSTQFHLYQVMRLQTRTTKDKAIEFNLSTIDYLYDNETDQTTVLCVEKSHL